VGTHTTGDWEAQDQGSDRVLYLLKTLLMALLAVYLYSLSHGYSLSQDRTSPCTGYRGNRGRGESEFLLVF
jgi:hypothetical protein